MAGDNVRRKNDRCSFTVGSNRDEISQGISKRPSSIKTGRGSEGTVGHTGQVYLRSVKPVLCDGVLGSTSDSGNGHINLISAGSTYRTCRIFKSSYIYVLIFSKI